MSDDEFHSVVDTMEAVASYWTMEKNRFALGHLERRVFSWSIRDVFNRDLLRHQVITSIKYTANRFIVSLLPLFTSIIYLFTPALYSWHGFFLKDPEYIYGGARILHAALVLLSVFLASHRSSYHYQYVLTCNVTGGAVVVHHAEHRCHVY